MAAYVDERLLEVAKNEPRNEVLLVLTLSDHADSALLKLAETGFEATNLEHVEFGLVYGKAVAGAVAALAGIDGVKSIEPDEPQRAFSG